MAAVLLEWNLDLVFAVLESLFLKACPFFSSHLWPFATSCILRLLESRGASTSAGCMEAMHRVCYALMNAHHIH